MPYNFTIYKGFWRRFTVEEFQDDEETMPVDYTGKIIQMRIFERDGTLVETKEPDSVGTGSSVWEWNATQADAYANKSYSYVIEELDFPSPVIRRLITEGRIGIEVV